MNKKKNLPKQTQDKRPIDRNKKPPLAFYFIMFLIPIFFFIAFELVLRMINYGHNYKQFITSPIYAPDMLYLNPETTYKYFSNLKNPVFSDNTGFYKKKKQNTFRIFVFGESSVQGFPYPQTASFPSYLKRRLDLIYADREIEVINLGASAISSFVILDLLPEVLKQQPDLILIYAGHNEYYGTLGAASTSSLGKNRKVVNLMLYLRNFKVVEFIRNIIGGIATHLSEAEGRNQLMHTMIGENSIPMQSETYKLGIENFEGNLIEILEKIKDANIPVIIGTVTSNVRDLKPFITGENQNKEAFQFYKDAKEYLAKGDLELAKNNFIKAKELDGLRFRAPEDINKTIRKLGLAYKIPLTDIDSLFNAASVDGIVGFNLMCDHLHPNLEGYQLMGRGFFDTMKKRNLLPDRITVSISDSEQDSITISNINYTKLDSVKTNGILLSMLGSYPFVLKGTPNVLLKDDKPEDLIEELSKEKNIDSARTILAVEYAKRKDYGAFSKEVSVFLSYFPFNENPYLYLNSLLSKESLTTAVNPYIQKELIKLKPSASKYRMLGLLKQDYRDLKGATQDFDLAISIRPEDKCLYYNRGVARQEANDITGALEDYNKALSIDQNYTSVLHNRGVIKYEQRDYQGTIDDFDKVIKLNRTNALAFVIRGYAKYNLDDKKGACTDWKQGGDLGASEARSLYLKNCK